MKQNQPKLRNIKKNEYYCPACKKPIKVAGNIILSAETQSKDQGLILLKPELGDYEILKHDSFKLKIGEIIKFSCPICNANLKSSKENMAEIILINKEGINYTVQFSEILGEQITYKVQNGKIKEEFGKNDR